jgi:hypothetical protein
MDYRRKKIGEKCEERDKQMLPIYSAIEVYRAIRGRDHASHLRPAIATRPRNTILPSAYHCLEQHEKQRR